MITELSPIKPEDLPDWIERCHVEYVADLIASGEPEDLAHEHSSASLNRAFPNQLPAAGHAVFDLIDQTRSMVGYLWIGPDSSEDATAWWVWDIYVEPDRRGGGNGRAAMRLGEEFARSQGARTLGLNVFGSNGAARRLYESLGYESVSVKMRKHL